MKLLVGLCSACFVFWVIGAFSLLSVPILVYLLLAGAVGDTWAAVILGLSLIGSWVLDQGWLDGREGEAR